MQFRLVSTVWPAAPKAAAVPVPLTALLQAASSNVASCEFVRDAAAHIKGVYVKLRQELPLLVDTFSRDVAMFSGFAAMPNLQHLQARDLASATAELKPRIVELQRVCQQAIEQPTAERVQAAAATAALWGRDNASGDVERGM